MAQLEVLSRPAHPRVQLPRERVPLLFVHGAYVGAWCWDEHFLDWFAERGYPAHAVSLRGHGRSEGRDQLDSLGLSDYADDVRQVIASLPQPPVLVGHSMGALVVQKSLEAPGATAPAMILACPVPSYGLLPSSFSLAMTRPALFAGMNDLANGGRAAPHVVAEALFSGSHDPEKIENCYRRMQRESRRALFDMSGWGLPMPWRLQRPPTLVLGAGKDVLFSVHESQATARMLGAEFRSVPDLGHGIMLDTGWERAAGEMAVWLGAVGL